jgi:uncharacterized coiled-coil DUF342 family protein
MLTLIIIVAVVAGIAYFVTKNKIHLSSIKESIKETVEKVETAVAPAIEEVKEIVEKAEKVAPKNEIIAETKSTVETVAKVVKPKTTKKPAAKTTAKKAK